MNNTPQTAIPPAAWLGWDWADRNHDLFLETAQGQTEKIRVANRPDILHAWLKALGQRFAIRSGVAPRRVQSGNTCRVSRRLAKPQFLHQTWIEFAKCSVLQCHWARDFVETNKGEGKSLASSWPQCAISGSVNL